MPTFKSLNLTYERNDVQTYEISTDPITPGTTKFSTAKRSNEELQTWLKSASTVRSGSGRTWPLLRMIHLQFKTSIERTVKIREEVSIPLTVALRGQITNAWSLPVELDAWLAELSDRVVSVVDNQGASTIAQSCYVFNCKSDPEDKNSALLIVAYTPSTPMTTAILATSYLATNIDLAPFLNSARKAAIHPMLLPAALVDLMITSEASGIVYIDSKLSELENANTDLLESASKMSTSISQAEGTAKTLNLVRSSLGRSERRLQSLKYLLDASLQYMQDIRDTMPSRDPQWDIKAAERILKAHKANLRSDVQHLLLQVQNNNARVQTQQQAVYNFMTTREAISGRLIAAAGMKDGAAMKALALLTTVFLPGTYIATLFAMPVIEWSSLQLPIGGFALYWTVTVLLTVVVLSAWAAWMRLNERRLTKSEDTV